MEAAAAADRDGPKHATTFLHTTRFKKIVCFVWMIAFLVRMKVQALRVILIQGKTIASLVTIIVTSGKSLPAAMKMNAPPMKMIVSPMKIIASPMKRIVSPMKMIVSPMKMIAIPSHSRTCFSV